MRTPSAGSLAALLLPIWLAACASRPVEIRQYVLTQSASSDSVGTGSSAPSGGAPAIGVGPVRLPPYLRTVQIVTRVGTNELRTADTERWGEDLDRGLARVVAENLSVLVPTTRAVAFPWRDAAPMDYRVSIDVQRFERAPDGAVVLEAHWAVAGGADATPFLRRTSLLREGSEGTDYSAAVSAMSSAAGRLSQEIAAAIRDRELATAD
jgi:uncharacterized protein